MEPLVVMHLPSGLVLQRESFYQCLPEHLQAVLNVGMVMSQDLIVLIITRDRSHSATITKDTVCCLSNYKCLMQ